MLVYFHDKGTDKKVTFRSNGSDDLSRVTVTGLRKKRVSKRGFKTIWVVERKEYVASQHLSIVGSHLLC